MIQSRKVQIGSKALEKTSPPGEVAAHKEPSYYEFEGLSFADSESLKAFLQERNRGSVFGWIFDPPREVIPLLTSMAFGLLGGAARLARKFALAPMQLSPAELISAPLFGSVIGLLLFFLSLILPALFVSGTLPARPETLIAFSLFGGVFSEQAYQWIESQIGKVFTKNSE